MNFRQREKRFHKYTMKSIIARALKTQHKCEHIWEGDSLRGIDILGKAKTIRWSVCIKCGAIIGIQSIEEVGK